MEDTITIELGPLPSSENNRILTKDGTDILPDLSPRRIVIESDASTHEVTATIYCSWFNKTMISLIPDNVTLYLGDDCVPNAGITEVATALCHDRHPCWSIVHEVIDLNIDGQAEEFLEKARLLIDLLDAANLRIVRKPNV